MYYRTIWNYELETTQDIRCPEYIRISDGPRWVTKKMPWAKNQKFYNILDLDTGNEHFMTSTETRVHCGIARDSFLVKMNNKKKRAKPIRNLYLVHRIPKLIFVRNTGRQTDEQRKYFYRY